MIYLDVIREDYLIKPDPEFGLSLNKESSKGLNSYKLPKIKDINILEKTLELQPKNCLFAHYSSLS